MTHEGAHLGRRVAGRQVRRHRHPGRPARSGERVSREDDRGGRRDGRRRHGGLPRWQRARRGDAEAPHPQGGAERRLLPGAVRLGLQEQGRPVAARRGGRLPAVAGRSAADQGHRSAQRRRGGAPLDRRRSAGHARLQGDGRPVRRHAHLLPHLFRHSWRPARRCSTRRATARSASAACCSCMPTTARTPRKPMPATSSRWPASRKRAPATRCATRRSR